MRYALLADGTSDRALLPILTWLLRQYLGSDTAVNGDFVDESAASLPDGKKLQARIVWAVDTYDPDLLFVHRDAEKADPARRRDEIVEALTPLKSGIQPRSVPVIPVRMTEAWLLIDAQAIRTAAGNPRGRTDLKLPPVNQLETEADPKALLHQALLDAGDQGARRRKQQTSRLPTIAGRVSDHIAEFSKLRALPAFRRLEGDVKALWLPPSGSS